MTAANELDTYRKTIRRITFCILAIGPSGAIAAGILKGPEVGIGFLLGAALSAVSFWRWKKIADSLGGPPKRRSTTFWVLRFAVLVAACYVIVKYLGVSPAAVFCGLLVSAAAVIIALIYELIYGT